MIKQFAINFLKMVLFLFCGLAVVFVGSVIQVVVNRLGIPLWIQWTVGFTFLFCFIGALVKTTLDRGPKNDFS